MAEWAGDYRRWHQVERRKSTRVRRDGVGGGGGEEGDGDEDEDVDLGHRKT